MKTVLFLFVALSSALSVALRAEPLRVGETVPDVSGLADSGEQVRLADIFHSKPFTLVYFYPKADTPGCTKQGCSLRDAYAELEALGVSIIGVSIDSLEAQRAFKAKYKLPFTLLADTDRKIIDAFRVPTMPAIGFATRQAFLIQEGKVVWADYRASTEKQAADVMKAIEGLKKK